MLYFRHVVGVRGNLLSRPCTVVRVALVQLAVCIAGFSGVSEGVAAGPPPPPTPGLTFTAVPAIVDVGDTVTLTVAATRWPAPVSVKASFLSPHHGFTGQLPWRPSCGCFQVTVGLARRIHPLEQAKAVARITIGKSTVVRATTFSIRGLAANGKDFSPGGPVTFQAWVADPAPTPGERQHFCGWVKTPDGLGIPGYRIKWVVHYQRKVQRFTSGTTGRSGVACTLKSVGNAPAGVRVDADAYTASFHVRASFTPRAA